MFVASILWAVVKLLELIVEDGKAASGRRGIGQGWETGRVGGGAKTRGELEKTSQLLRKTSLVLRRT